MRTRKNFKLSLSRVKEREREKEGWMEGGERERRENEIYLLSLSLSRSLVRTNVQIYRCVHCTCDIFFDSVIVINTSRSLTSFMATYILLDPNEFVQQQQQQAMSAVAAATAANVNNNPQANSHLLHNLNIPNKSSSSNDVSL